MRWGILLVAGRARSAEGLTFRTTYLRSDQQSLTVRTVFLAGVGVGE